MSKNAILKTISLTQIGRKKFYRTAINPNRSLETYSQYFLMTVIRKLTLYMIDT